MDREEGLHILGGGPAGLGIAVAAGERGLPFTLYEASDHPGGNARTLALDGCLYDTGAHRFHDKDPETTRLVKHLLGDDLLPVNAPSVILDKGRFIDFPLHLKGLLGALTPMELLNIGSSFLRSRCARSAPLTSFRNVSVHRYGRVLAERFLLNYSEKLWGIPTDALSPEVSGGRLKGLSIGGFLKETFRSKEAARSHLDGSFYYPRHGIGMIADRLAGAIGPERIRYRSRITRVFHNEGRITGIELNGEERVRTDRVLSTLPLTLLTHILSPAPPDEIIGAARNLRFRHLLLAAIVLRRERLSDNASIYFPDRSVPFTRLYESKNRSREMAPPDRTCVVLELPCGPDDRYWLAEEKEIIDKGIALLADVFGIGAEEVAAAEVRRIPFAYPVLDLHHADHTGQVIAWLSRFGNLHLGGRNGLFRYVHIHDLLASGRKLIEEIVG